MVLKIGCFFKQNILLLEINITWVSFLYHASAFDWAEPHYNNKQCKHHAKETLRHCKGFNGSSGGISISQVFVFCMFKGRINRRLTARLYMEQNSSCANISLLHDKLTTVMTFRHSHRETGRLRTTQPCSLLSRQQKTQFTVNKKT